MFIALTGTPGTGKTTLAQQMRMHDIKVIDFHDFALKHHCDQGYDAEKDTIVIDIDKVNKALASVDPHDNPIVIEGHLSHLLVPIEKVIILRCHPKILLKRLQQKGWKREKITENIEAEILDVILCESLENHPKESIYEIDNTQHIPSRISKDIAKIVKNQNGKYRFGKIDWSEEILKHYYR